MEKVTFREYELNIFWEEFWDKHLGTWWDDKLTIDVYKYESGWDWSHHNQVGVNFKLTREESLAFVEYFPEAEYGNDWFVFLPEVINLLPERAVTILGRELPELEPVYVKEETVMNETVEEVKPVTHNNIQVLSVMGETYVPDEKTVQVGFSTHIRKFGGGITSSFSIALTDEEAVELIDSIEEVMAQNKRTINERKILAEFYKEAAND